MVRGRPAALDSSTTWISFLPTHSNYFIVDRTYVHLLWIPHDIMSAITVLQHCTAWCGHDSRSRPGTPRPPPALPPAGREIGPVLSHRTHLDTAQPAIAAAKHDVFSHTNSAQTSVLLLLRRRRMKVVGQSGQTGGKMVKSRKFKFLSLIWNAAGSGRLPEGGHGSQVRKNPQKLISWKNNHPRTKKCSFLCNKRGPIIFFPNFSLLGLVQGPPKYIPSKKIEIF